MGRDGINSAHFGILHLGNRREERKGIFPLFHLISISPVRHLTNRIALTLANRLSLIWFEYLYQSVPSQSTVHWTSSSSSSSSSSNQQIFLSFLSLSNLILTRFICMYDGNGSSSSSSIGFHLSCCTQSNLSIVGGDLHHRQWCNSAVLINIINTTASALNQFGFSMRISRKRLFLSSHSSAWLSVLFRSFFLLVLLSTNLTKRKASGLLLLFSLFSQVVTRSTLFFLFLLLLCWTLDPYLWVGTNGTVHLLGSFEQTWAQVLFLLLLCKPCLAAYPNLHR